MFNRRSYALDGWVEKLNNNDMCVTQYLVLGTTLRDVDYGGGMMIIIPIGLI